MSKIDLQLFQTSLRVVAFELGKIHDVVPSKVFEELEAMDNVIERDLKNTYHETMASKANSIS